ncbi:MAG: CotH kinase family protein, partial [Bacteroidia bacterium]
MSMRILIVSLCLIGLLIPSIGLLGQDLPEEIRFSSDGERLVTGGQATTGFYDKDDIPIIELTFTQSNYWTLLSDNYDTNTDLMATVSIDGEVYDSVGIRFKGLTSYFLNFGQKKSFNISLNYLIKGQDHRGYETLNLNSHFDDPSYLREVFYHSIGRNYTPALKANFALLRINGQDWGVYANTQQLNGQYLSEWFLSNKGTRWRALASEIGPGGIFGEGTSTLNYNGPDSTDYNTAYTLKKTQKADPWADLIRATDKLNNLPLNQLADSLTQYLDVDKTLWFLAHEIIFTDEDSYVLKGGMDYYVYWEPETDRIVPLEYDGNSCMQLFSGTWSPFFNENDVRFPLMNRLFAEPELRQRYLAHLRTILDEYYIVSETQAKIDVYASLLDSLVQADPYQIYSYNEFLSEISSLKSFLSDRHNYLSTDSEVNVSGLDIQQVNFSTNGQVRVPPTATESVQISAALSGSTDVEKAYLYFGSGLVGAFHKVEMLDDGNHNDGSAGDGVYGAEIPPFVAGTYVRYYIEAIANNTTLTATY